MTPSMPATTTADRFLIVGANHRSSSLALRDALFVDELAAPSFLDRLAAAGLSQAVVLSTADRVEVWAVTDDITRTGEFLIAVLAERAGVEAGALKAQLYRLTGVEALRQAFAVAAGLDSLVVGEPHSAAQLRQAHRLSQASGLSGAELEGILAAAFAAAERAGRETGISDGAVSVAAAAIQFARDLHGRLDRCEALLVGSGEMGELVAEHLLAAGVRRLSVTGPRAFRSETLAKHLGGHVAPYDDLPAAMSAADIVVGAVGQREYVLRAEAVKAALKKRKQRPIFLIDTGIPGDVEPAVNDLDNAFLYDLNDLERVVLEGRATREAAARQAWTIIDAAIETYRKGHAEAAAPPIPALGALRARFEAERVKALEEAGNDAEAATRLLVARLLVHPADVMRAIAGRPVQGGDDDWATAERVIRRLFRLDGGGQ